MTFNYCKIYKRVKFRRWDAGDDRWATTAAGVNNRGREVMMCGRCGQKRR